MFIVFFGTGLYEEYWRESIELWAEETLGWCIHSELMPWMIIFLSWPGYRESRLKRKWYCSSLYLVNHKQNFFFMSPWCYALLTLKSWFWNRSISVNRYNKFCTELQNWEFMLGILSSWYSYVYKQRKKSLVRKNDWSRLPRE